MNIQHILAIIFFIPVGFFAIGSAICLIFLPFQYLDERAINRKVKPL